MEKWKEANRKFHDSDYETGSDPSFVTASVVKSVSTEVYIYNMQVVIVYDFFLFSGSCV